MLILPVINRGKNGKKISNAKIELVNCKRLGDNSSINTKVGPENVIIDGKDLASSRNYSKKDLMKFIKDNSINSKKDFFINTKNCHVQTSSLNLPTPRFTSIGEAGTSTQN